MLNKISDSDSDSDSVYFCIQLCHCLLISINSIILMIMYVLTSEGLY